MRLLLDTHVVLWATRSPETLSQTARVLLAETDNELLLSPVVAWELTIKHRHGKLPEAQPLLAAYSTVRGDLLAEPLPICDEHSLLAGSLDWAHKDPFDRMLAAQTMLAGAALVSADRVFDGLPGLHRLW
ncbi:MAG: type II toxin-antitoxin system VapC family toxin [Bifidobacteriaceae bacterium]|jgi:PIN domain nuclease of toxin-antitoxin system|nr:type II toxin-antitoxin system VapC family toxin [Bifidobacteriaceae bacterium]